MNKLIPPELRYVRGGCDGDVWLENVGAPAGRPIERFGVGDKETSSTTTRSLCTNIDMIYIYGSRKYTCNEITIGRLQKDVMKLKRE